MAGIVLAASVAPAPARAADADPPGAPPPAAAPSAGPGWLGVTMDPGGDLGVRVEHVVRTSPAARAGVRVGDRIVAVDGEAVTAPAQVTRRVGARRAGEAVGLELERGGSTVRVTVVLGARPSGDEILRMDLVGATAPGWTNVTPLSGAPASLDALRGRVVLLDFWASWCGPCRMLAPRLSAMKDRLGAQGLSVVGITTDEAERAAVYAERHKMRYGVVVDAAGDTTRAYGISSLPTMLLLDKKGVVREVFVGFDPGGDARVEAAIRKLLAEPAPPARPSR